MYYFTLDLEACQLLLLGTLTTGLRSSLCLTALHVPTRDSKSRSSSPGVLTYLISVAAHVSSTPQLVDIAVDKLFLELDRRLEVYHNKSLADSSSTLNYYAFSV